MTVAIYETRGHLTGAIPTAERVSEAQAYLLEPNMEEYLDPPLQGVVVRLRWYLDGDGYNYRVEAICRRELTEAELKQLSEEVSGQNSDGHGEGFEQQDFAWLEEDCGDCEGCVNWGHCDDEGGRMCSFDWEDNKLPWTRVR